MATPWQYDTHNPYDDIFEEALLPLLDSPHVFDVVRRKFVAIQQSPKEAYHVVVRGQLMYIVPTGRIESHGMAVEPLMIVYTLQEREKLIQKVFVCKTSEYASNQSGKTVEEMAPALGGAIERAMTNASRRRTN